MVEPIKSKKAFFPEDGNIHFDSDEKYTDNTQDGTNLFMVAVHEIGRKIVKILKI